MYPETVEKKNTTLSRFCQGIEETINSIVKEVIVLNWDEDFITRKFLFNLTQKLNGSLISDIENKVVFLTPFKLSKPNEQKFGDIAIIVNIEYNDGDKLEGIAFLEAKRKYKESGNYDAIKWEQLERLYKNAPHSQLLLYDYRDISEFAATGLVSKKSPSSNSPLSILPVTKFVSIPINKSLQIKKKNENLYKLSLPLSYQIGYRYLNGFDLEYNNETLKLIKGDFKKNFDDTDVVMPDYLIHIDIIAEKNVEEVKDFFMEKKRKNLVYQPKIKVDNQLYYEIKKMNDKE